MHERSPGTIGCDSLAINTLIFKFVNYPYHPLRHRNIPFHQRGAFGLRRNGFHRMLLMHLHARHIVMRHLAIVARAEEHQIFNDDLGSENLRSLGTVPTTGLQIAFYVERLPLPHALRTKVCKPTPRHQVVILRKCLLLSCVILPHSVCSQPKRRNRLSVGSRLQLRIAGDISKKCYFVH